MKDNCTAKRRCGQVAPVQTARCGDGWGVEKAEGRGKNAGYSCTPTFAPPCISTNSLIPLPVTSGAEYPFP